MKGIIDFGAANGIEKLPHEVRDLTPVVGSEDEAIFLAFASGKPVAFIDKDTGNGGVYGLFSNTLGARVENPGAERMDELRKAAEPLRAYLVKYGDGHTCVTVTPYGATETRDGRRVSFREETLAEQEAQFERELKAIVTGNG